LSGPYGPAGPPIAGIGYWAEGPTAIWLGDQWIVYFDRYMEGKMGAAVSKDLKTWSDVSHRIRCPEGTRHGSVIRISSEEFEKLNTLLPHNRWFILRSGYLPRFRRNRPRSPTSL